MTSIVQIVNVSQCEGVAEITLGSIVNSLTILHIAFRDLCWLAAFAEGSNVLDFSLSDCGGHML